MNKVFYFNNKKTQEKIKNFQNIFDKKNNLFKLVKRKYEKPFKSIHGQT